MKPQFITNLRGKRIGVFLNINDYQKILEKLEEYECVKEYDKAKKSDDEIISFEQAVREIEG